MKLDLYLRTKKGFEVLNFLCRSEMKDHIAGVWIEREERSQFPAVEKMQELCRMHELPHFEPSDSQASIGEIGLAIGWARLIKRERLLVFHDSLLPKYRGFNPLVTALQNGDREIGATAIWAVDEVDAGPIVCQKSVTIVPPVRIAEAMNHICDLYVSMCQEILPPICEDTIPEGVPQSHELASYSVWRDELDMNIDWSKDAETILRFILSVGHPYEGAAALFGEEKVRVLSAEVIPDLNIINRTPGKVLRLDNGHPVVICGSGLLRIQEMTHSNSKESLLPTKFLKRRLT